MFEDLDFPRFPEEFHWLEGAVCGAYGMGDIRKIAIGLEALADDEKRMLYAGVSSICEIVKKAFFAYERQKVYQEFPELKSMLALVSSRNQQEKIVAGVLAMPIDERALLPFLPIQSMIDKALHSHEKRAVLDEFPSLKTILQVAYSKVDQDKILTGLSSIPRDERWRLNSDFASIKDIVDKALTAFEKNGRLGNVFSSSSISEFVAGKRNEFSRYSEILCSPNERVANQIDKLKTAGDGFYQLEQNHTPLKSGFLGIALHRAIEERDDNKILEILRGKDFTIDVLKSMHEAAKMQPEEIIKLEGNIIEVVVVCNRGVEAMAAARRLLSDEQKAEAKTIFAKKKVENPSLSANDINKLLAAKFNVSISTINRVIKSK